MNATHFCFFWVVLLLGGRCCLLLSLKINQARFIRISSDLCTLVVCLGVAYQWWSMEPWSSDLSWNHYYRVRMKLRIGTSKILMSTAFDCGLAMGKSWPFTERAYPVLLIWGMWVFPLCKVTREIPICCRKQNFVLGDELPLRITIWGPSVRQQVYILVKMGSLERKIHWKIIFWSWRA